jgi:hypothetical protein
MERIGFMGLQHMNATRSFFKRSGAQRRPKGIFSCVLFFHAC